MNAQRIFLDLDRTLLDTERLVGSLFAICHRLYGFPIEKLRADIPNFYFSSGNLRHYDMFGQLASYGIGYERAKEDLKAALSGQDFMYPGASDMLHFLRSHRYKLHIISFGKTDYQKFKYHVLPEVQDIPITIIFADKTTFLQRQSTMPSVLVDDKLTWPLPAWCVQFLLEPDIGQAMLQENPQLWHINALTSVKTLLTKV